MILAAGFGTRLGTLSDERPKPLLPVADVPLIRYAVALLSGHGIKDIVVNLHHRGELIERELGDGASLGVRITYSREKRILGTGGGIRRALHLLGDSPFVVINGKILIDLDLTDVLAKHRASGAMATLVVRPDPDAKRWGAIDAPPSGGPIRTLLGDGGFMFTGVHVINPELVTRLKDEDIEQCIVRQGYVSWLAQGVPLFAHVARGYFMEHSTPARYLEGNLNVLRGKAVITHPPGELVGVDATARVAPSACIIPPVRVGPHAIIGSHATVGPDVVIGARSVVAENTVVRQAVAWPDTQVTERAQSCIITPTQRVAVL
ncbi:MAG: NDP-sugar synthase [Deltaproteobacteria bacterium]|nr:NDP-sugar synthase [Deltaproteobacteria bacterium]